MDFSFVYNGEKILSKDLSGKRESDRIYYKYKDIAITQELRSYGSGGAYSLLWFENCGSVNSGTISEICDVDAELEFEKVFAFSRVGMDSFYLSPTKIVVSEGCNSVPTEYIYRSENLREEGNEYSCFGGRSSQGLLPYFEVKCENEGLLLGIGWSGQWVSRFKKETDKSIRVQAGIQNLSFYLRPGEKIRTASILLLRYADGSFQAHNRFRNIIKKDFSVIGKPGRGEIAPLSMLTWGGARSDFLKKQIRKQAELGLGFEYFWMDAGWYGDYTEECPDTFLGNWGAYTGDWTANKIVHPNGLAEIYDEARQVGIFVFC